MFEAIQAHDAPTLPGFALSLADRGRRAVGALGELTAWQMLEKSGYQVSQGGPMRGDLRAISTQTGQIFNVEVKTARRCTDGRWRFTLRKNGHCDHRHSDIVILLAIMPSGRIIPFVVPVSVLADQKQAVITSHPEHYSGKLAVYRQKGRLEL